MSPVTSLAYDKMRDRHRTMLQYADEASVIATHKIICKLFQVPMLNWWSRVTFAVTSTATRRPPCVWRMHWS